MYFVAAVAVVGLVLRYRSLRKSAVVGALERVINALIQAVGRLSKIRP